MWFCQNLPCTANVHSFWPFCPFLLTINWWVLTNNLLKFSSLLLLLVGYHQKFVTWLKGNCCNDTRVLRPHRSLEWKGRSAGLSARPLQLSKSTSLKAPRTLQLYHVRMQDYEAFVRDILCIFSYRYSPIHAPMRYPSHLLILCAAQMICYLHGTCFSPTRCIGQWSQRFAFTDASQPCPLTSRSSRNG